MRKCNLLGAGFLKLLFFCGFSFTLLFLNFYINFLHSAEQGWFSSFDHESERLILGRLVKSRQDGIFSHSGFPVLGVADEDGSKDPLSWTHNTLDNYDAYIKNERIEFFARPYISQIGGQGIFYSILDKIIPCNPAIKLRLFHGISSLLIALVVMAIIAWFYLEFGLFAGLTVLAFAAISQWLTVFARSLWWSTWAFYLPMALVMLYLQCTAKSRHGGYYKLWAIVFFSILIKTMFNGYEYMTTTLVMMVVPFVYYSVLKKVSFAVFFNSLIKTAMSAGLAIAVSVCILSCQIAAITGNFFDGYRHLTYTFQKRTHENLASPKNQFLAANLEGMQAPVMSVVKNYLHESFCGFDLNIFNSSSRATHARYYVSYARVIALFALMTCFLYLFAKRGAASHDRSVPALIIASWLSILAPLSWFIIFKSHSYAHTHLNSIVWQMPFTFFGAAITGLAVKNSVSGLISFIRNAPASR